MPALKVDAKGDLTLHQDVLRHLHAESGDEVLVETSPDGKIMLSIAKPKKGIEALFGSLKRKGQPVLTIEQISESIEQGWAGER
jgi:antitoxin component of MazEF toxin-antitoxin module